MATSNKHDKHSEDLMTSLTALIGKGRREGVITNTELMAALEKLDLSVDKIERVYDTFDSIGIQIVNGDGEGEGNGALPELLDDVDSAAMADIEEEPLVDPVELAAEYNLDDPVRMYLKGSARSRCSRRRRSRSLLSASPRATSRQKISSPRRTCVWSSRLRRNIPDAVCTFSTSFRRATPV